MRARLAEIAVETSVGDVKIKQVICLHKKKVSRTEEDEEIKVMVRKISEQRGDFTRTEGGKMGGESQVRARGGKQKSGTSIFIIRSVAQRAKQRTGLLRLCRHMKIRSVSGFS